MFLGGTKFDGQPQKNMWGFLSTSLFILKPEDSPAVETQASITSMV